MGVHEEPPAPQPSLSAWRLSSDLPQDDEPAVPKSFALVFDGSAEADDTEIASFQGYHAPWWKRLLSWLAAVVTLGASLLAAKWSPRAHILLSLSPCTLVSAQFVLITLADGRTDLEPVVRLAPARPAPVPAAVRAPFRAAAKGDLEDGQLRRPLLQPGGGAGVPGADQEQEREGEPRLLLEYRCSRYFYVREADTFRPVPPMPRGLNQQVQRAATLLAAPWVAGGSAAWQLEQPAWQLAERTAQYGSNEMRIPVKTTPSLIFNEMFHPFYVFQYFSIIVWCWGDQYYSYAVCIAAITWFSIISSAVEAHRNMRRLADIAHFESEVQVMRGGRLVSLPSSQLVPGDVIVVRTGTLPCDAVLLRGQCIVDENMLTGESVPVRKVAYSAATDGLAYSPDTNTGCTLFGGTHVAQARSARGAHRVLAMVTRTRFFSAKGQLLRSILFPREAQHSFVSDSLIFIVAMLAGCLALYAWAAVVLHSIGASNSRILVRLADMITIAVPPALPACLTIATVFSLRRFRKRDVYVTSPERIAFAGQLDVIAFDKTGTLTEQGLDLQGIVPVHQGSFQPMTDSVTELPQLLQQLLASCHGLARMGDALVGDPLDQILFQATQWELLELEDGQEDEEAEENGRAAAAEAGRGEGGKDGQGVTGVGSSWPGSDISVLSASPLSEAMSPAKNGGGGGGGDGGGGGAGSSGSHSMLTVTVEEEEDRRRRQEAAQHQQHMTAHHLHHHHHHHTYVRPPGTGEQHGCGIAVAAAGPGSGAAPDGAFSIVKRFEFSSALQRNMVLVRPPDSGGGGSGRPSSTIAVFTKGSPEAIRSLVDPATVPPDFDEVLGSFTREGLRVLALAAGVATESPNHGSLTHCSQAEVEARVPLSLVGLAVLVNPLRPDSADVVKKLQDASIRTAMVTGDHLRTAISVAHLCGIMPPGRPVLLVDGSAPDAAAGPCGSLQLSLLAPDGLASAADAGAVGALRAGELACAVTGRGFSCLLDTSDPSGCSPRHDPDLLLAVLCHATVYARMSPDHKRDLMGLLGGGLDSVEGCPHLGLHVGFCGDGANDCGALKAAHVGVSLCEAEASVAAPMTSKNQTTASMLTVVAEGRCSLMATFQIFQFIIGYALVQAFETNINYTFALNVGNYQFLIEDLFFTTVLAALMGKTEPRSSLSRHKPLSRVMSLPLLVSTLAQLAVVMAFQLLALGLLAQQPGYVPTQGPTDLRLAQAPENTTTYLVALSQFIILALVFNQGKPHRSPLHTNMGLLAALVAQTAFVLFSLFSDCTFNREVQELVGKDGVMDDAFRVKLLALMVVNGAAAFAVQGLAAGLVAGLQRVGLRRKAAPQLLFVPPKPRSLAAAVDRR